MQDQFNAVLNALNNYNPRKPEYLKDKINLLDNAKKLYDGSKIIIDAFKNKVFPFERKYPEDEYEYENEYKDENGHINFNRLANLFYRKERDVSKEVIRKHFLHQNSVSVLEKLNKSNNNTEKNKIQEIKSGLRGSKEEIKEMSEDEVKK